MAYLEFLNTLFSLSCPGFISMCQLDDIFRNKKSRYKHFSVCFRQAFSVYK